MKRVCPMALGIALLTSACAERLDDIDYVTLGDDFTHVREDNEIIHRHVTAVQVRCLNRRYVLVSTELPGRVVDLRCALTELPPTAGGGP